MRGVTKSSAPLTPALIFLLTRLMRGVTIDGVANSDEVKISTHTPHARRDMSALMSFIGLLISTHTPHARRDRIEVKTPDHGNISTHTPHARRDNTPLGIS